MFSVLFELVISRLTSISDTRSYQQGTNIGLEEGQALTAAWIFDVGSTQFASVMTLKIGAFFNWALFGNPILVNIVFQTIAYIGLIYLLLSVERQARRYLAILVLLPSFSLWSSIASKEAIVVFAMGILCGYLLRMYRNDTGFGLLPIAALLVVFLFKPHFLAPLAFALVGTWLCFRVRRKAFLALIGGLASLVLLYMIRDMADETAFAVQRLLFIEAGFGRSSRLEPFLVDQYDLFLKAPLGMFLAFFGPKLTEIFVSPLALITFIESTTLTAFLFFLFAYRMMSLPVYSLIIGGFTLFWIMFPNYMFGVSNIGTAIRYRTGWLILIFAIVAVLMSRDLFLRWQAQSQGPQSLPTNADATVT